MWVDDAVTWCSVGNRLRLRRHVVLHGRWRNDLLCCCGSSTSKNLNTIINMVSNIINYELNKKKTYLRPKRRETHRLGPFPPSHLPFFSISCNSSFRTYTYNEMSVTIKEYTRIFKKDIPKAQMTQNASFGPVFVVTSCAAIVVVLITYKNIS